MFRLKVRSPPDNIEKVTVLNLEKYITCRLREQKPMSKSTYKQINQQVTKYIRLYLGLLAKATEDKTCHRPNDALGAVSVSHV